MNTLRTRAAVSRCIRISALASTLGILAAVTACGGTSTKTLSLVPPSATLRTHGSEHFSVPGVDDTQVTSWLVDGIPGGNAQVGTIDDNGVYTAPGAPPASGAVAIAAVGPQFSATASVSVDNRVPTVKTIIPSMVMQSPSPLAVTVEGTGFNASTRVQVGGLAVAVRVMNATKLVAEVPPAALSTAGTVDVVVSNPAPGGGTASAAPLTVAAHGTVTPTGNPQVALYTMNVPRDAAVSVEFGPDTTYGRSTWALHTPPGGGEVRLQVAGMRDDATYHMRARVALGDGATLLDSDHTFTTGLLPPERTPQIRVQHFAGMTPGPGIELLNLIFPRGHQVQATAVDLDGNVVWYYDVDAAAGTPIPLKQLPNGDLLMDFVHNDHAQDSVREIDLAGHTIREVTMAGINAALAARGFEVQLDALHHDVTPLPNGHIVVLGNITKALTGLQGYTGATTVQGDALVDLDASLMPVWAWSTFDHLDPNRHLMGLPDWTHSNAVLYTPNDGNLLLSMRHQSWIIKIDYENGLGSGAVLWRLGNGGDFALAGGDISQWQYGQHYPRIISIDGSRMRLAVMDNGYNRVVDDSGTVCGATGAPACFSRMAIFDVDEETRTASVAWEYRPGFYSIWGGSTEILGNGDVEGAFSAWNSNGGLGSTIIEVTPDGHEPVWQLNVSNESAYRGFRVPSLYPGVQW